MTALSYQMMFKSSSWIRRKVLTRMTKIKGKITRALLISVAGQDGNVMLIEATLSI